MTCSPAPVATQAWTDTLAKWPGVTFLGIVGDQAHQTRRSSHNCAPMQESGAYDPNHAHALDIGHGGDRTLAAAIRVAFLADPRTRYVIDNGVGYYGDNYSPSLSRRIWDAVRRVFTRTGPRTFRSTGHTTHVHVSFLPGTTFDTRPFFTADTEDDMTQEEHDMLVAIHQEIFGVGAAFGQPAKPSLRSIIDRNRRKLNRLLEHFGLKDEER